MKTIAEAAKEYMQREIDATFEDDKNHELDKVCSFHELEVAFFYGAKWALENQWHDASKELPYKYSECFEENESNYTKDILCCSKKGIYYTDYMFKSRISKEWRWSQKNSYDCKYWMPIPNIPKELKLK